MAFREARMMKDKPGDTLPNTVIPSKVAASHDPSYLDSVFKDLPSFDQEKQPIRYQLRSALIKIWECIFSFGHKIESILQLPKEEQSIQEIEPIVQSMIKAGQDLNEVQNWLYPQPPVL